MEELERWSKMNCKQYCGTFMILVLFIVQPISSINSTGKFLTIVMSHSFIIVVMCKNFFVYLGI